MPKFSYEQYRHTPRPFSDAFVERVLNNEFTSGDTREYTLKGYLDNVAADETDKAFAGSPEQNITFRNEFSDLVADKLAFAAPADKRPLIGSLKEKFVEKLRHDKARVAQYFRTDGEGRYPVDAMDFYGLNIDTAQKGPVDLLDGNVVSNIRANFQMQRGASGLFAQWTSKKELISKANGQEHELGRRFYFNPAIKDTVAIFREIMDQVDAHGLSVKGKIYDRSNDSDIVTRREKGKDFSLRGDPIVFYVTKEESDRMLEIAEKVYMVHPTSFKGRKLSRIPQKIADGIGIGDDPGIKGESLASHVEGVIGSVAEKVRERRLSTKASTELFRVIWRDEARRNNVDPDNPAFNAKK